MSNQVQVACPRCKESFRITRDYGAGIVCPYCGLGSEAQWDGDACRLIDPNPALYPNGRPGVDFPGISVQTVDVDHFVSTPPTGTVEAVMSALEHSMFNQMGIPAHLVGGGHKLPERVNLRMPPIIIVEDSPNDLELTKVLAAFDVDCAKVHIPIIHQAQMMDMKIVNNRKRMRKRVRQRRRHWSPPHWTEYPGDW